MSNIFNLLIQLRIEQFNKVNPAGAGNSNIKPGQVIIAQLLPKPVGINGEVMECSANWHPSNSSVFYKGQRFKMIVDVLYNKHSRGEKNIPVTELPGKLLDIYKTGIAYEMIDQKPVSRYNVTWTTLVKKLEVVTPENAWSHVFFGNAKTLGEASDQLTNSAPDSLLAAYDLEARFGSSMVDPMDYTEDDMYDNLGECYGAQTESDTNYIEDSAYDSNSNPDDPEN